MKNETRGLVLFFTWTMLLVVAACTTQNTPNAPTGIASSLADPTTSSAQHPNHNSAAQDDKGYIDGWIDGEEVQLHYTKSFFCAEPPASGAASNCEVGADAQVAPRPGPIPTIYAIAAAGISPDPSTLACRAGTPCFNHPAMLDLSRVGGPSSANAVSHSHIISRKQGGWFNTVNIRVRDLGLWNQIAAARSLDKIRELQANPANGGLISADTPTNIYFFIASWK